MDAKPRRQGSLMFLISGAAVTEIRRQHLVRRVHQLGARALEELLAELIEAHDIADDVMARLERYARLEPELVRADGADRFAPTLFMVAS